MVDLPLVLSSDENIEWGIRTGIKVFRSHHVAQVLDEVNRSLASISSVSIVLDDCEQDIGCLVIDEAFLVLEEFLEVSDPRCKGFRGL